MPRKLIWEKPSENVVLGQDEVHVWRVSLMRTDQKIVSFGKVLSLEEKKRMEKLHLPKNRARFLVSHGALRQILARYLKTTAEDLNFSVNTHGKPLLIEDSLHFNLSHAEDWALIAIAKNGSVGVDVEKIRDNIKAEEIARRFFAPTEVASLAALSNEKKLAFFLERWTQKESYSKALGLGLSLPFNRQVDKDPLFAIKSLNVAPGYCAAVAAEGTDWEVFCWEV